MSAGRKGGANATSTVAARAHAATAPAPPERRAIAANPASVNGTMIAATRAPRRPSAMAPVSGAALPHSNATTARGQGRRVTTRPAQ